MQTLYNSVRYLPHFFFLSLTGWLTVACAESRSRMPGVPCGALQHHTVPVACAIIYSWLLILVHSAVCQKPAKLPLVGRKPFLAAWNAPLDMCMLKYKINVTLDLFHISGSPRAVHTGQNVTIFYTNRLGYYPFYNDQGVPINGGLPQNSSLEAHLHKARKDIAHFIPSEDFRGLAVIDWEFWRPQWDRNWNKKYIYRQRSSELIAQAYLNVTDKQVEELARLRFEKSAKEFMQSTLKLGTQTRPHGLWGFYLYPDCHNYNVHEHDYNGTCPKQESKRNDQLFWLWNSSTALFPALAIRKSHMDSVHNLHFSQNRVVESLRLASLTSLPYELPTYVYTRLGYRDEAMTFLTQVGAYIQSENYNINKMYFGESYTSPQYNFIIQQRRISIWIFWLLHVQK